MIAKKRLKVGIIRFPGSNCDFDALNQTDPCAYYGGSEAAKAYLCRNKLIFGSRDGYLRSWNILRDFRTKLFLEVEGGNF